jgi:hypothetical protein
LPLPFWRESSSPPSSWPGSFSPSSTALLDRRLLSGAGVLVVFVVVFVVAGGCVAAAVLHTRPQGGKQVGDLVVTVVVAGFLALLDRERLSPGRLGLDELLELDPVVVLVLSGSKSPRSGRGRGRDGGVRRALRPVLPPLPGRRHLPAREVGALAHTP